METCPQSKDGPHSLALPQRAQDLVLELRLELNLAKD